MTVLVPVGIFIIHFLDTSYKRQRHENAEVLIDSKSIGSLVLRRARLQRRTTNTNSTSRTVRCRSFSDEKIRMMSGMRTALENHRDLLCEGLIPIIPCCHEFGSFNTIK